MSNPICHHTIIDNQIILEDNTLIIQENNICFEDFQESEAINLIKSYINEYNFSELTIHIPNFEGDDLLIAFLIEKEIHDLNLNLSITSEETEEEIRFF